MSAPAHLSPPAAHRSAVSLFWTCPCQFPRHTSPHPRPRAAKAAPQLLRGVQEARTSARAVAAVVVLVKAARAFKAAAKRNRRREAVGGAWTVKSARAAVAVLV